MVIPAKIIFAWFVYSMGIVSATDNLRRKVFLCSASLWCPRCRSVRIWYRSLKRLTLLWVSPLYTLIPNSASWLQIAVTLCKLVFGNSGLNLNIVCHHWVIFKTSRMCWRRMGRSVTKGGKLFRVVKLMFGEPELELRCVWFQSRWCFHCWATSIGISDCSRNFLLKRR